MQIVKVKSLEDKVSKVRDLILSTGNQIGNVHFRKRTNGQKRRMSYRVHVRKPSYASEPGKGHKKVDRDCAKDSLLVVFDVNKVRYNKKGNMNGRGDWRCIPLETVTRIAVGGEIYKIV